MPTRSNNRCLAAAVAGGLALVFVAGACGGTAKAEPAPAVAAGTSTAAAVTTPAAVTTAAASTTAAPVTTAAPTVTPVPSGAPAPGSGTTSCTSVVHIGDSTSVGLISPSYLADASKRIDAQYRRVGAVDQHLEISGARSIVETLPGQVNAHDTAAKLKAAGFDGCWVFALGTTDTANVAVGSGVTRAARIDSMMAVAGDDPVLWVDVKTLVPSGAWSNTQMQTWNQALLDAQAKYPNLKIYDWASVVQDPWFSSDRIHYTSAGYAERGRLIADALATAYPA